MKDNEIIDKIKGSLKNKIAEITNPAARRIFLKVDKENLLSAIQYLKELGFVHLSTISGVDKGDVFEILYHFANESCVVNIRITTPRNAPKIPSICAIIAGAILYERELQDMFGLIVEDIPDPRPLVLPDDWPVGAYPLRKDWKFERPPEIIPGEE